MDLFSKELLFSREPVHSFLLKGFHGSFKKTKYPFQGRVKTKLLLQFVWMFVKSGVLGNVLNVKYLFSSVNALHMYTHFCLGSSSEQNI